MAKPTTIRIDEDLLNEINEMVQELKSAATSRAGGIRMAPGRGRGHLCWSPLIF